MIPSEFSYGLSETLREQAGFAACPKMLLIFIREKEVLPVLENLPVALASWQFTQLIWRRSSSSQGIDFFRRYFGDGSNYSNFI